jgi:hypothetical protein
VAGERRRYTPKGIKMLKEEYLFEIPIYRTTKEQFYLEVKKYIEKRFLDLDDFSKDFYNKNPIEKENWDQGVRQEYGSVWEYNDIIGYLKLFFYGSQIRSEYWFVKAKRIVKTNKKNFDCHSFSTGPAITIVYEKDSVGIYQKICELIDYYRKKLKIRFIDTSIFDTVGPYIDWESLYNKTKKV